MSNKMQVVPTRVPLQVGAISQMQALPNALQILEETLKMQEKSTRVAIPDNNMPNGNVASLGNGNVASYTNGNTTSHTNGTATSQTNGNGSSHTNNPTSYTNGSVASPTNVSQGSSDSPDDDYADEMVPVPTLSEYFCIPEIDSSIIVQTRNIKVSGVTRDSSPSALKSFFEQFGTLRGLYSERLISQGQVYISYFDLRSAIAAYNFIGTDDKMSAAYCVRTSLTDVVGNGAAYPVLNEGEIRIDVVNAIEHTDCSTACMHKVLEKYGKVYNVYTIKTRRYTTLMAEFYDIRDAMKAVEGLDNRMEEGWHFRVKFNTEATRTAWISAPLMVEINEDLNACVVHAGSRQLVGEKESVNPDAMHVIRFVGNKGTGLQVLPPPGYQTPDAHLMARSFQKYQNRVFGIPRSLQLINSNVLDLYTLKMGYDLRHTIMIRNIPNKLSQRYIKAWLDEVSFRKYDFLYLRIDFHNQCNVGYCFVNFVDMQSIIEFVEARSGMQWYQSDKVVELCYANIQTKAALIEKFRNSSVMDQKFDFRPRTFFTSGVKKGLDMPFPAPNDLAKKLRSVTSAASDKSGLYNNRHRNGLHNHRGFGRFPLGGNRLNGGTFAQVQRPTTMTGASTSGSDANPAHQKAEAQRQFKPLSAFLGKWKAATPTPPKQQGIRPPPGFEPAAGPVEDPLKGSSGPVSKGGNATRFGNPMTVKSFKPVLKVTPTRSVSATMREMERYMQEMGAGPSTATGNTMNGFPAPNEDGYQILQRIWKN